MKKTTTSAFYSSFKKPVAFILLLILGGGFFTYSYLQKSLFPEITFPKIKIIADNGDQPVDKMMITVTKPLEDAVKQIPDIQLIRSVTSRGSSELSAFLNWNANIYTSQQLIESRINQIRNQLPAQTQLSIERMNPSILPVMGFILESKNKSLIELKMIAKYQIKPFLSQLEGVAKAQIQGGKDKEYWATLKPDVMSRLGISPSQVQNAVSNTGFIESNGFATDYRRLYLTLIDASVSSISEMQNLVISNDGKRVITLGDVADVSVQPMTEYIKINTDGREGVLVNVVKQPAKNLIELSQEVDAKTMELQSLLPAGVEFTKYYDQADFVATSIRSVIDAVWIGLVFAIIITIFFLRSFRSSLTLLIVIPATLGLSTIFIYLFGYTLNLMTLGAIAAGIGLIIDDAIIVVEQIHRIWEEHPDHPTKEHIKKAISYLFPAMVGSSLSTIVIFFPFSLMSGVAGAYFKVLADTMIITLACSFFVVWLILPVIYLLLAGKNVSTSRTEHKTEPAAWSGFLIRHPSIALIFMVIMIGGTVWVIPKLQTGFLPEMDEGTIILDFDSPPGTSLAETEQLLKRVDQIISKNPEVANYSRRTGTQLGFFITEPSRGDYLIQLKENKSKTTDEVINEIRTSVEQKVPALIVDFGQVIGDMLGDLMSSVQPIEIKVFGDDPALLQSYAHKIADITEKVSGTADVFDGIVIAGPSISINPKEEKLAYYNLSASDFWVQVKSQVEGIEIGHVLEKQQLTPLRMIYPDRFRNNISKLDEARISLTGGVRKPISEFADIVVHSGSAEVERENLQPMIPVTARLENRDLGSTVNDIKQAIAQQISLPSGYHITYGGAYAEQQQSFKELLFVLMASSLLVFTVILFLFRNISASLIIFLTSIFGVTGSILALYLTGTPLNVGSYTGIIMIVGIIAENAIFTYYQFHQAYEVEKMELEDAINYSISLRLRPKLMTASAAIAALMPLALAIGAGAQLHQPLAISVIGGLVTALPLLLLVLPTLLRLTSKITRLKTADNI